MVLKLNETKSSGSVLGLGRGWSGLIGLSVILALTACEKPKLVRPLGETSAISIPAWRAGETKRISTEKTQPPIGDEAFSGELEGVFLHAALERECRAVPEGKASPSCHGKLVKWTKPIRFYVYGAGPQELSLIDTTMGALGEEAGLSTERVEHRRQGNLRIFFYRPEQRTKFLSLTREVANEHGFSGGYRVEVVEKFAQTEEWPCVEFLTNNLDGTVSHAAILVHTGLSGESAERCISLSLLQVMGFPKNRIDVSGSILGRSESQTVLTEKDHALVRLLYSEQVKAGMGRFSIHNALKKISD